MNIHQSFLPSREVAQRVPSAGDEVGARMAFFRQPLCERCGQCRSRLLSRLCVNNDNVVQKGTAVTTCRGY